jgi:hypothetical protein
MADFYEEMRKCVAFIGCPIATGGMRITGTCFFFGIDAGGGRARVYVVTARHVLNEMKKLGVQDVAIRVNIKEGGSQFYMTRMVDWYVDPDDDSHDIAVIEGILPHHYDHLVFPDKIMLGSQEMAGMNLGLGTQVAIVGLFKHLKGSKRNIPIVRVGTLASLIEERVPTEDGEIDAYLVEVHSIGGLSGSPVFLEPPLWEVTESGQPRLRTGGFRTYLIGLVYGHFDEPRDRTKAEEDRAKDGAAINTGIAIVTPVDGLLPLIEKMNKEEGRDVHITYAERFAPF